MGKKPYLIGEGRRKNGMEDYQIIALYNSRDSKAIDETHAKYGRLCYSIADGILHSRQDSEESVNDTYMAVWNAIPPDEPECFSAYLCRIVRNVSLKKYEYLHAAKRNKKLNVPLEELENVIADSSYEALVNVEVKELGHAISAFLRTLQWEERNIFIRRYWFFHKTKEIAADFSCSESKVKSQLFRTRNKLRDYLLKNYFKEDEDDV